MHIGTTLSAFVRAIGVIVRDLLSACTANMCKCCFYCCLRFVFPEMFKDRVSFCVILLGGLFSPHILWHRHSARDEISPTHPKPGDKKKGVEKEFNDQGSRRMRPRDVDAGSERA
ncbi:hypothetical protein AVEN_165805-1 [Araneus ventricosus]|uniref:Uncharacterized protein n=1 Tax=Araneus ventricosus TaxID=182803 RepID=A0A4Y2EQP6_ARAVE|nr:hypothetical protein AVEN_165805-1 [Araneus ventricosus]